MPSALQIVAALDSERRNRRRAVFERILALAQAKVVSTARASGKRCVFSTPLFLLGQPPYDWRRARAWVARRLVKEGFEVRVEPDSPIIEIDWTRALSRSEARPEARPAPADPLADPLAALHAAAREAASRR